MYALERQTLRNSPGLSCPLWKQPTGRQSTVPAQHQSVMSMVLELQLRLLRHLRQPMPLFWMRSRGVQLLLAKNSQNWPSGTGRRQRMLLAARPIRLGRLLTFQDRQPGLQCPTGREIRH